MHLSPTLTLNSILHVPKLSCNLVSISKLTHDNKCLEQFSPTACFLVEQMTRKAITKAVEGLYLWEDPSSTNKSQNSVFRLSVSLSTDVMLWHKRLGHPNFLYLKRLLPHLFINIILIL